MVDLQREPDAKDHLVAPSDVEHLRDTKGFDHNQNVSNARTATTEMDASNAPPRPANFSRKKRIAFAALFLLVLVFIIVVVLALIWENKKWHALHADQPGNKQQQPKSENKMNRPTPPEYCVVPAYPEYGKYIIESVPTAKPGDKLESLELRTSCLPGYRPLETGVVLCVGGTWNSPRPKCVRFCKLDYNPSVRYDCRVSGYIVGHRKCNDYEPSGTVVEPKCNGPNYAFTTLPSMTCIDGSWDHVATCSTECGRVTQTGVALMSGGRTAKRGELPWHVGIYRKTTTPCPRPCPYEQICGGSIVANSVIISAAHCFWNVNKKQHASMFVVAAGKIYRIWDDRRDVYAQKSFVKEINIPDHYQGELANYQDDIAVVILETPFNYTAFVGHVCLSFDVNFEKRQLQHRRLGKVAGWGLVAENGESSQILKVVEMPYVDIKKCIKLSQPNFKGLITSDKICAGYRNETALRDGDSGGGLAFPDADRYYLRGIVSVAPETDDSYEHAFNAFTQILKHKHFILLYI